MTVRILHKIPHVFQKKILSKILRDPVRFGTSFLPSYWNKETTPRRCSVLRKLFTLDVTVLESYIFEYCNLAAFHRSYWAIDMDILVEVLFNFGRDSPNIHN